MISKSFLAKLSCNVTIEKQCSESYREGILFGRIEVDDSTVARFRRQLFTQSFEPDLLQEDERLEMLDRKWENDKQRSDRVTQIGRKLHDEFETVVIPKRQIQVTDSRWHQLLSNSRRVRSNRMTYKRCGN
jgi:hypothetical protein